MAWIELHQSLRAHPKLLRLARALNVETDLVRAKLENLWLWALEYRDTGALDGLSADEIAEASNWRGDAEAYVFALTSAGWLDQDPIRIHDWDLYAGRLVDKREANKVRAKHWRQKRKKESRVTHSVRVPNTATKPYLTEPNQTIDPSPIGDGAAAATAAPAPKVARAKAACSWPEGFTLDAKLEEFARSRGIADPAEEFSAFHDYHRAKGSVFKCWRSAWQTWCRNTLRFGTSAPRGGAPRGGGSTPEARPTERGVSAARTAAALSRWTKKPTPEEGQC